MSSPTPPTTAPSHIIFLIHGIRTHAHWQPLVRRVLGEIPGTKIVSHKYGYLDAFRFWFPFLTREPCIQDVWREIQNAKGEHPDAKFSVVAHSFGTYAITRLLRENPGLRIDKLVLCGSIVPRSFRWDHVKEKLNEDVINDYGTRDIWPVLAKCLSWGYGDTGRHGFGRAVVVIDRAHDYAHSDFFNEEFVREFWHPWFQNDEIKPSQWDEHAPKSPLWLSLLSVVPLQWLFCCLVAGLLYFWMKPDGTPPPPPPAKSYLPSEEFEEGSRFDWKVKFRLNSLALNDKAVGMIDQFFREEQTDESTTFGIITKNFRRDADTFQIEVEHPEQVSVLDKSRVIVVHNATAVAQVNSPVRSETSATTGFAKTAIKVQSAKADSIVVVLLLVEKSENLQLNEAHFQFKPRRNE